MRKIEEQMQDAVRTKRNWTNGNTSVVQAPHVRVIEINLHGNMVGKIVDNTLRVTLAGWNTPTTRSRVNALCKLVSSRAGVSTKQGQARFTGPDGSMVNIGDNEWVEVGSIC